MCICAVAAREGNDIIRVDMCHGSFGHTFPKVTIPNKNVTSHGTVIHKDSSGLKWVVIKPFLFSFFLFFLFFVFFRVVIWFQFVICKCVNELICPPTSFKSKFLSRAVN